MKVVIVGGVAGGASAAARLRRLDEKAEIVIFEKSGYISYANCGLPYYVGDKITEERALTVQTPESFQKRFRIKAHVRHEVLAVHPEEKTVTVKNLVSGEVFEETYDKLLLATGARPTKPELPGIDLPGIYTLRTVEDALALKKAVRDSGAHFATVVGGGFIGVETAENLREAGLEVTIVEYADHLLANLDRDMAAYTHAEMRNHGVSLLLGTGVTGFEAAEGKIVTHTSRGTDVESDMVLLAVGVAPDTRLAKEAGLVLGIKGSILVNDRMETSVPDIYAVGDSIRVKNFITDEPALIPLAGPANKQGRIAADNMAGGDSRYKGTQGSSVIKVFDRTAASTGLTETAAKRAGYDCESLITTHSSHASYYPGGKAMTLKITFERGTNAILGAQIVGFDGVDKRIDVIATALRARLTAPDLAELELAYAPPYSSAKDPVNMAGFMAENISTGLVKQFDLDACLGLPRDGSVFLLDARTPAEYARGNAPGFVNIPVDELRDRLEEIPKDRPIYVMCQSGLRSYIACRILSGHGYDCYNFTGGYGYYKTVTSEAETAKEVFPCGMEK